MAVTFQVSCVTGTLGVGGSLEPGDMLTVPDDWSREQAAGATSKKQSGSKLYVCWTALQQRGFLQAD